MPFPVAYSNCPGGALPPPSSVVVVEGQQAPAFSLTGDDGAVHTLAQHAGTLSLASFAPGAYEIRLTMLAGAESLASRAARFTVAE